MPGLGQQAQRTTNSKCLITLDGGAATENKPDKLEKCTKDFMKFNQGRNHSPAPDTRQLQALAQAAEQLANTTSAEKDVETLLDPKLERSEHQTCGKL